MKLKALRNPMKSNKNSPDYIILNGNQRVGVMYKNRDSSGLVNFNIILDDNAINSSKELVIR